MVAITKVKKSKITNIPPTFYNDSGRTAQMWANSYGSHRWPAIKIEVKIFVRRWLDTKRDDDSVEDGLWRIRDTLYDLTDFILKHPGGPDWLRMTKGHDITESFITHHISIEKLQPLLEKYRVRDTTRPRNVKLTFAEDGFYMTLKRRVAEKLPEFKTHTKIYSKVWLQPVSTHFVFCV